MKRVGGFTLIELLVVVIIVVLLASTSVGLLNVFFRGQGVRQAGAIVMQAVAQSKQAAAETRIVHFLVFSPATEDGWMEIHKDVNGDGSYQGDQVWNGPDDADLSIGPKLDVPRNVVFEKAPYYVSFQPSGFMSFSPGFSEMQAGAFDAAMNANTAAGDVILKVRGRPYRYCMDLDRGAGKIRRHFFNQTEVTE